MDNNLDVISVGDAIVDAFLTIHDANTNCVIKEGDFCVRHGAKIIVDSCAFLLGGNACNVAVGLSKMGFKSALSAEIGDDEFSEKIIKGLIKENIDTSLLLKTKGASSSFAIGINFKGERTLFVEHIEREHNFTFNKGTKWVYLTSLGHNWEDAYKKTLDFVNENSLNLAFSPGTTQLNEINDLIKEVLKITKILFVNKEEAIKILNSNNQLESGSDDIKNLLVKLQEIGPKIVVITDGRNGSYLIDENREKMFLEMFPGEPLERTGAGDAYTSGFLGATLYGLDNSMAMKFGSANASSVVQKIGAQPGLLSRKEIEEKLSQYKEFQTKVI